MNAHAKIQGKSKPAAEHSPDVPERRRFTADELLRMEELGILHEDENVELLDGEIIRMAAKSPRHEDMRILLSEYFTDHGPKDLRVAQEPAFRLADQWEPEPDILLFSRSLRVHEVRGPTALLVVEVAYSSLSTDLEIKAPIYAAHGVREYWVVDAKRQVTHVHREPGPDGYRSVVEVPADQRVTPLLLPSLAVKLADLGLEPLADETEKT